MEVDKLLQAIDACRPDQSDFSAPELAPLGEDSSSDASWRALHQRSAAFDRAVQQAFQEVEAPSDLEERLLASVLAATAESIENKSAENQPASDPVSLPERNAEAPIDPRRTRRSGSVFRADSQPVCG